MGGAYLIYVDAPVNEQLGAYQYRCVNNSGIQECKVEPAALPTGGNAPVLVAIRETGIPSVCPADAREAGVWGADA